MCRRRLYLGFAATLLVAVGCGLTARAATYYVAPGGNDLGPGSLAVPWGTIQKAADTLGPGDTVLIRAGTYNERVVLSLSGTAGAEITFAAYPGERPVIDGTGVSMPDALVGLFDLSGVGYIRVRGLTVQKAGPGLEHAGFLMDGSHDIVLEGNFTYDTTSSGIGVWGSRNVTLDGNEVVLAVNGGQQECISVAGTTGFDVLRNLVHDSGITESGGEGIDLKDGSNGGRVRGNRVWNLPRSVGIYVDAWDKHTFDIEISGNVVHDVANGFGFGLASEMGGLLENIRILNNVVWGNGSYGLLVGAYGGVATHPMKDLLIANNTLAGNGTGGWGGGIAVDSLEATGVTLRNNLVSGNLSFQVVISPGVPLTQVTVDHNLIDGFREYEGETRGTDYVEGDPLFADAAAHDFHLQAGSPALDRGSAVGAPATDLDGVARPQGTGIDIGAFERVVGGGCAPSTTALCLNGARFWVQASFQDYAGVGGTAQAVPLTGDTGYFWFFSASNVELIVKILDGTAINGKYWAFYGALSTVQYTITITDTLTGAVKQYQNSLGNLGSVADTGAF